MRAERNLAWGWTSIALGIAGGLLLGLFSFEGPLAAPEGLADYAGLPRRLLRLAHIAWVALGALNVLYALDAGRRGGASGTGGVLLILGSLLLPPALAVAAFLPEARFFVGGPALLVAVGTAWIAVERIQAAGRQRLVAGRRPPAPSGRARREAFWGRMKGKELVS